MRHRAIQRFGLVLFALLALIALVKSDRAQKSGDAAQPAIPKTWDDEAMARLEVPLADPRGSPKHVSADYYYKIPVRAIYKQYPLYGPGQQPAGYIDALKQREPEIIWGEGNDGQKHAPPLRTKGDWIKAGEIVFDAPIGFLPVTDQFLKNPGPYVERIGVGVTKDGVVPFDPLVIRVKGKIEMGVSACAECHTRSRSCYEFRSRIGAAHMTS